VFEGFIRTDGGFTRSGQPDADAYVGTENGVGAEEVGTGAVPDGACVAGTVLVGVGV
jgi:hypothetical protein